MPYTAYVLLNRFSCCNALVDKQTDIVETRHETVVKPCQFSYIKNAAGSNATLADFFRLINHSAAKFIIFAGPHRRHIFIATELTMYKLYNVHSLYKFIAHLLLIVYLLGIYLLTH